MTTILDAKWITEDRFSEPEAIGLALHGTKSLYPFIYECRREICFVVDNENRERKEWIKLLDLLRESTAPLLSLPAQSADWKKITVLLAPIELARRKISDAIGILQNDQI